MKRNVLIFVLAGFLLNGTELVAAGFLKSLEAAQAEAKKKDQVIFVDLFAEWCGWCHRMEREVFPSETFQTATRDMVLLRVDTEDGGEGTKLARTYHVRQLPTFLLIDADGLLAGTLYGYSPADKFAKRLLDVYSKYETFKKNVSAENSFSSDYRKRLELAEEFISRGGYPRGQSRLTALIAEKRVPEEIRDLAYYHLAASQLSQKQYSQSLKTLEKFFVVQSRGDSLERARLMMSQIYFEQGDVPKALAELKSFKQKFPASPLMEQVEVMLPQLENAVARKN